MTEDTVQVFIEGVTRFFQTTQDKAVRIGTPYLVDNKVPTAYDVTGIIGISGPYRGCVYFTVPRIFVKHLLLSMGETDTSNEHIFDLVGEVANTISGNARSSFGQEFLISVPVMLEGSPDSIHLPKNLRSYVIPIHWKSYSGAVVVCLDHR